MLNYTGVSCPYCNQKFNEDDDIVVCPECGAPHHRECWEKENKCHFSVLHSENFEWKKPFDEEKAEEENVKTVTCSFCGTENPENAISCKKCKSPINIVSNDSENKTGQDAFLASLTDPLGGVPKNADIGGVTAEELGKFIGDRSPYFVRMFYILTKRNSSVSFNFFACIFNGFWFLSKKMYKLGIALCAVSMLVFSARAVTEYYLLSTLGSEFTVNDLMQSPTIGVTMAAYFLSMVQFAIMVLCGMFANSLYMKHCTKTIKSVENSETKSAVFAKKGGVNMVIAVSLYACYMIISTFSYNIIEAIVNLIK